MNRYTQITPAGFDPLSVEEIMLVPLGKQKMYDEQEGKLAEMMIDSQYLPQDKENVEAKLSEFNTAKLEVSERLSNTGDIRNTAKKIMELKAERERLISSAGEVGRAKTAYDRHMKYEDEMLKNPRIDRSDARRFINHSLDRFQGSDKGEYKPFYGANSANGMEKSISYGDKIAPQTLTNYILGDKGALERFGGIWGIGDVYSADGQKQIESLIRNNYSTIIKDPNITAPIIYSSLKMDRELNDYLYAVGESSGLRSEQLDAYVDNQLQHFALAGANNTMRQDYSASQDLQNIPQHLTSGRPSGDRYILDYDTLPFPSDEKYSDSATVKYIDKLQKIRDGVVKKFGDSPGYDTGLREGIPTGGEAMLLPGYVDKNRDDETKQVGTKHKLEDLPKDQAERLNDIAQGLKMRDKIDDIDLSKDDVMDAVIEYEKNNSYVNNKSLFHLNRVSDLTKNYGQYSTGIDPSDRSAVLNQQNDERLNATYMDPETGNIMNFKELSDAYEVNEIVRVNGYIDSGNLLPTLAKESTQYGDSTSEWVSPMIVEFEDKNGNPIPMYKARTSGQRNTPRYKADVEYNDIAMKPRMMPNLPIKIEFKGKPSYAEYMTDVAVYTKLNNLHEEITQESKNVDVPSKELMEKIEYYMGLQQAAQIMDPKGGLYEIVEDKDDSKRVIYTSQELKDAVYRYRGFNINE